MDSFYKIASVNKDEQCNLIKPFDYSNFDGEINPITLTTDL